MQSVIKVILKRTRTKIIDKRDRPTMSVRIKRFSWCEEVGLDASVFLTK